MKSTEEKKLNQELINYEYLIKIALTKFNIKPNDYLDAFQEGRIGLLKALKAYNEDKCKHFIPFALLCIKRQILSFLRNQNRKKNKINQLDYQVSFDDIEDKININYHFLHNINDNTLDRIHNENVLRYVLKEINGFEREIFKSYIYGYTVNELTATYNLSKRKVYSIIAKVRKKFEKYLNED
ncbi:MAG TPA: sigma-70 family RNA polymerase sigma factor [Haloplasmataceae bacterium]